MGFDNAYEAITEETDDHRWAFGTGFTDPLLGVDTALPAEVPGAELGEYCQMLGDDALVFSHRLQEWLTRAPELEEETALANVALDLLGQARYLLTRAGQVDGSGRSEDDFAFRREAAQFRNVCLVEPRDEDFAMLIARLLVFSAWRLDVFERLRGSRDSVLAAVAAKAVPELAYHRDYAAQWAVRLGDGTDLSRGRMRHALDEITGQSGELFAATEPEGRLAEAGAGVNPEHARAGVSYVLAAVAEHAGLDAPRLPSGEPAGRLGRHTAALADALAEMQSVARAHPAATW
jgi:ring-1,2-phenylacetyl-CoA epoxidase subunit PaaC